MRGQRLPIGLRQVYRDERPDGRGHRPTLKDDTEPTLMSGHLLGGLVVGILAVVVGIGWILGALRRRSDRAETAPTFAATGGVAYAAFQIGCPGLRILGGPAILCLMLGGGRQ